MKYKRELVIIMMITLLVLLLRILNVFQIENHLGKPVSLFLIIVICSGLTIYIQHKIDNNYQLKQLNYDAIDLVKYIFSILIIILHARPFLNSSNQLDLAFNNIITRVCVPFFFLVSGYFIGKKEKDNPDYIKLYIKKMIPLYLIWSVIYIPVIFATILRYWPTITAYIANLHISAPLFILLCIIGVPIVILLALLYTGIYYHLWYFPAIILSLVVLSKWKKKYKIKYLFVLSFFFLLFGASETYYGMLPLSLQELVSYYYHLFFTTRNFLFFGLFYVVGGYIMGRHEKNYSPYCFVLLVVSIFMLVFEAIILQNTQRLNSNILLSCIPLVYYLFCSILYLGNHFKDKNKILRNLSKYYYLIHSAIIFMLQPVFALKEQTFGNSILMIVAIVLITHIISLFILIIKRKRFFLAKNL